MSTFANNTYTNPLTAPVGVTPYDKITSDLADDVVKLDGMCYTKRRQIVASHSRRDYVGSTDNHPLRPYDLTGVIASGRDFGMILTQFVWGLQPDVLPGSDGATISGANNLADSGGFAITTVGDDIDVVAIAQRISISGTYGEGTLFQVDPATYVGHSHASGGATRKTSTLLIPKNTVAGERLLLTLFAYGGTKNGTGKHVQHWCIDEHYSTNLK